MIVLLYFIFGAVFGSFACCQAQRLHLKEQGKPLRSRRSVCLHCNYQLRWFDNIPILSWLTLRGKCRKCGRPIGWTELLAEVGLGLAFALLGFRAAPLWQAWLAHPSGWPQLMALLPHLILLITLVAFWLLLIYDARWHRLPTRLLYFTIACGLVHLILQAAAGTLEWLSTIGGIGLLAGVYYLLYFFSHETIVGSGDWLLALALALFLADWWLALLTLFLSNALASLLALPALFKRQKKHQIPLGPFLIVAFVLVYFFKDFLLSLALPL